MPKIIEMKKDDFLKKVKGYAANKKEKPTKLYITPDALAVIKVKFIFAKTDEVILTPESLSFFKKSMMGRATPAKVTDADASKTYYFSFCAALLKELAAAKIYAGKSVREKLEALTTYLDTVRDGKIIFEVISKASINITQQDEEEKEASPTRVSLTIEENVSCSESFIEGSGSELDAREEGDVLIKDHFQELFEESRRRIENQDIMIQGFEAKIQAYEALAHNNELKIKKNKIKIKESRLKAEKSGLKVENLTQALHDLELENTQLRALHDEGVHDTRVRASQVGEEPAQGEEVEGTDASGNDEGIEYGNEINNLIGELDGEEAEASLHLSEVIAQWNNRLHWSRSQEVTTQVYNGDQSRDEEQALVRFIALAKLEKEKAAHFANDDKPWLKEAELAKLQEDGHAVDLECFALYQNFPEELKKFAILFAFWEMAHHNRFYRNALETVLNGGNVPATLGMAENADITNVMLNLLHYADLTRILMGHYHYLARHQFDIDLFINQAENEGRYGSLEGKAIDVSRATTEARFYQ